MSYKNMRNALSTLIVLVMTTQMAWAAPVRPTLQTLASDKMFQYAITLYDRGNEPEGVKVLNRILELDPTYGPALAKLRKPMPKAAKQSAKVPYVEFPAVGPVMLSNEDLKKEIMAEDNSIRKLNDEIASIQAETEKVSQ